MGVPKFFRYMSERYPCLSEFVKEYQIPVFDNLYLDMNGIIHMCSHPDDNNPHFRITEEKLFSDIFHYIEVLFRMIKPQKVFFMAIDGVAPRAKMNQQRGRRFRSAKDAEKSESDAKLKGEKLPDTVRFDTNCITPGTEFMAKLHEQLKYFVVKKVSTDNTWKKCKVILSGHETPGEGEHKIMDYIRYIRSQPGYDPNTRHCLYGLDADLIMLGLCTHDPHFSLLREEVKFGKKSTKRQNVPEEIRFYVLHLSLMREYLELEFHSLKEKLKEANKFEFDIEKIIDDWVLMGFLVGNDFIPHLPNLHITNGALPILYRAYMDVLPKLDGYINEAGTLNLRRFETFMKQLGTMDFQHFEETRDDLAYMESKTGKKHPAHLAVNSKGNVDKYMDPGLAALIQETDELALESSEDEGATTEDEDEIAFKKFKDEYYRNKLEYMNVTPEVMRDQAEGYVRAIQWNLNYYYNGVCSWAWYYPHHYAPYISDIKDFGDFEIKFDLGKPFKSFEQLLAVLPAASKDLLPECYHPLMTDEDSPIKDYYPEDFQTDLNGKRQEWEAVVLIPFIDEARLLDAMRPCNEKLSYEELKRNSHGPMLIYEYTPDILDEYKAPNYFPTIVENHAMCTPILMEELRVEKDKLVKGAYPGARFDVFYPGFPTMKHLQYSGHLTKAKVKVFEQPSRNENMVMKIINEEVIDHSNLPGILKSDFVYVGWPHLVEAQVVAISDEKMEYAFKNTIESPPESKPNPSGLFKSKTEGITHDYISLMGVDVGKTEVLVHVRPMIGRKYLITGNGRITLEKQYSEGIAHYPLQIVVQSIKAHDDYQTVFREVSELFPTGTTCFKVTNPHYGAVATVLDSSNIADKTKLRVKVDVVDEPDFGALIEKQKNLRFLYMNLRDAATKLSISNYIFSRLTGSLFISTPNGEGGLKQVNIGLNLKFNKRNQETPGFTKRIHGTTWLYSDQAVDIVREYHHKFPEVIDYLSKNKDADDLSYVQVFGKDPDKVSELTAWLKTLPSSNVERQVCDSSVLDLVLIKDLEETLDKFATSDKPPKSINMEVHPKHLFKPESVMGNLSPDPSVQTLVFDRIVNVRNNFTVPLGLKGVVTAIHQASSMISGDEVYDVIFDKPFEGGMALNCSEQRGYRLPKTSFINITYGQRCMGIQGQLRAKARESQNNSFKIPTGSNNFENTRRQQNSAFAPVQNAKHQRHLQQQQRPPPIPQVQVQQQIDFMPTYGPKTNKENSGSPSKPKKAESRPAPVQILKQEKSKVDIDTECLKSLLKIGGKESNGSTSKVSQSKSTVPQVKPIVEAQAGPSQIMQHFQSISRSIPTGTSATARLLTFYQKNNLGCPRYDYFKSSTGMFAVQVVLPNQQIITGKGSHPTREEASEVVAEEVLQMIVSGKNVFTADLPSQFPVPPVNWVLPQQQQPQNMNNPNNNRHVMQTRDYRQMHFSKTPVPQSNVNHSNPQQNIHHKNKEGPKNIQSSTSSFVPLQAMKHGNKNRNISDIYQIPAHREKAEKKQEVKVKSSEFVSKTNENVPQSDSKQTPKAPRHKKPKVAANFFMNKS